MCVCVCISVHILVLKNSINYDTILHAAVRTYVRMYVYPFRFGSASNQTKSRPKLDHTIPYYTILYHTIPKTYHKLVGFSLVQTKKI